MPTNTHTGSAAVINITFDIRFQRTKVPQPFESDERNQSSKYAIKSIFAISLILLINALIFTLFIFIFDLGSPDDLDASLQKNNDVSGISPFFSSEDMNVSINNTQQYCESVSIPQKSLMLQIWKYGAKKGALIL